MKRKINVCFSQTELNSHSLTQKNVVVIDVLRATSSICQAFANGVKSIIPEPELSEAKKYSAKGFIVAAERNGVVLDFAKLGNSPYYFKKEIVKNQDIVYSTINGVPAILKTSEAIETIAVSFFNILAVVNHLLKSNAEILIVCSGFKGQFCLEDTLCAGLLISRLSDYDNFILSDGAVAALNVYSQNKNNMLNVFINTTQVQRLQGLGLKDKWEEYLIVDSQKVLPALKNQKIIDLLA